MLHLQFSPLYFLDLFHPPGEVCFPRLRTSPTSSVNVWCTCFAFYVMRNGKCLCSAWEDYRDFIPEEERGNFVAAYHKRLNSSDPSLQVLVISFPKDNTLKSNEKGIMYKFLFRKEKKHHVVQQKKKKLWQWKETEKWESIMKKRKRMRETNICVGCFLVEAYRRWEHDNGYCIIL